MPLVSCSFPSSRTSPPPHVRAAWHANVSCPLEPAWWGLRPPRDRDDSLRASGLRPATPCCRCAGASSATGTRTHARHAGARSMHRLPPLSRAPLADRCPPDILTRRRALSRPRYRATTLEDLLAARDLQRRSTDALRSKGSLRDLPSDDGCGEGSFYRHGHVRARIELRAVGGTSADVG